MNNAALKIDPMIVKTVNEELTEIKTKNNGILKPAMVVDYARNEKTTLHKKFLWDDSKAAEKYRVWQARQIISLELVIINQSPDNDKISFVVDDKKQEEEPDKSIKKVRAFVSLPLDRGSESNQGYRDVAEVMKNEDLREQLLESAKEDMAIFRRKYWMLEKLAKVFEAMGKV